MMNYNIVNFLLKSNFIGGETTAPFAFGHQFKTIYIHTAGEHKDYQV